MALEALISRFKKEQTPATTSKEEQLLVDQVNKLKAEIRQREANLAQLTRLEAELMEEKGGATISRRSFLKAAALTGIGVAIAGPSKIIPETLAPEPKKPHLPEKNKAVPELEPVNTEIAQTAAEEITKCQEIIEQKCYPDVLKRPCLVSALYYSVDSLERMAPPHDTANEEIIWNIQPLITKEFREGFIGWIKEAAHLNKNKLENKKVAPVPKLSFGDKLEENHLDAVDLFAEEGTPVRATSSGIVVLAENGWDGKNELATSSFRGGNSVIIFDPTNNSFERYVHLESMSAKAGTLITAGAEIGKIGHTGQNASLPGHGKHLHFEINRYDPNRGAMVPTDVFELKNQLEALA